VSIKGRSRPRRVKGRKNRAADSILERAQSDWRPFDYVEEEDRDEVQEHVYTVRDGENTRLDVFLAERLAGVYSREYLKELITGALVLVDGMPGKPGRKLRAGQRVDISIPPPETIECLPEDVPLRIHYEDEYLLVAEKPRGMLTHPLGRFQSGTFVNALLHHCTDLAGISGTVRPGIVHRLDRVTSGLLAVAKTTAAHRGLQDLFRTRQVQKRYLALVEGRPASERGLVDAPLGRNPVHRNNFQIDVERGRPSQTSYVRHRSYGPITLVELYLHTGRTHQIRVHMRFISHPVVGDSAYGACADLAIPEGIALHAWTLGFRHPITGEYVLCRAPIPKDMLSVLQREWHGEQLNTER